ncbi:MAG: bifunctional UDP-N-acetylglucosamine diphosphorylase/glucosamine-1-phosphate N-acetyltransferase GlmU [Acidobacteriota bacterium]|nr:MAG: bifunctional UDP-N-acetylglucosamine diphosphorylase/glucosamine-1-phosphate N-acetyltransferase GlmU [Acidobacteriota bacterium]
MRRRSSARSRNSSQTKTDPPIAAVILAAGEGTRMRSRRAKVLHEVGGRALVEHVVGAAIDSGAAPVIVVVGAQAAEVERRLREFEDRRRSGAEPSLLVFVRQTERRGTADAVSRARGALRRFDGDVLILSGDVPALPAAALRALIRRHRHTEAALSVLTAEPADASGYGRIVRGADRRIRAIVEHGDATAELRRIREINSGTYCARWTDLRAALSKIRPDNAQGEYYLTDAVRVLLAKGEHVEGMLHGEPAELLGINSREQLASMHRLMNQRHLERLMQQGVTLLDPATTWVHTGVRVGQDTILHPQVTLEGRTRIGRDCVVRSGCRLTDVVVGHRVELLEHTVASEARVGDDSKVGPFAHLRPGTTIGPTCKIGNFVETKKAVFGRGSKASHLSYLGDAVIGRNVNVGAGTITCNYDGEKKHQTTLADGVFIGSDTQLVAPVKVGRRAYVAAGSTVTKDVPPKALAVARSRQTNVEGWVERREQKRGRD